MTQEEFESKRLSDIEDLLQLKVRLKEVDLDLIREYHEDVVQEVEENLEEILDNCFACYEQYFDMDYARELDKEFKKKVTKCIKEGNEAVDSYLELMLDPKEYFEEYED